MITSFEKISPAARPCIAIVGILFAGFLILSNLTAFKIVQIAGLSFPAGLVFFPLTFIFDDILTEVYGFKVARRVIWSALFANIIIVLGTLLTISLPPSPYWHEQQAYAQVYSAIPRVFIASTISYLAGEFANSIILAKLKIKTQGQHLWLRVALSTMAGVGIDTFVFMHIAFLFAMPYSEIWKIIITMYLLKVGYEIVAIPLTYFISNYLKQKDQIDHYDFNTKFNPFSFEVD